VFALYAEGVLPDVVTQKLESLPPQPGVYLFKDKKGVVVYVGKAKSLRSRVRSYFQPGSSDTRFFIPFLDRTLGDLETIVTLTEKEAQILENSLIKQHHPRYNVKLRDDKEYLSVRLSLADEWPRLSLVRKPKADGSRYFGPYHSATAARRTLHLVNKHFQLRTCTDSDMASRKRPCLQHQIKRCPAPCVYEVSRSFYDEQVHAVAMFLAGKHDELSNELRGKMKGAVTSLSFELAAVYRDQLHAIDKVREAQRVVTTDMTDRDVFGVYRQAELAEVAILHVRGGRLSDVSGISLKGIEIPDEELLSGVIVQHYARDVEGDEAHAALHVPSELLLPVLPEASAGLSEYLSEVSGHKVHLVEPQRGPRARLLEMAAEQAAHLFTEKRRASDDVLERLGQIKEKLRLPTLPRRIECCDISHLGGGDTVGAIVALKDGEPDKARYRTFNVKTVGKAAGELGRLGDDYGAMYEVLARRFRRANLAPKIAAPTPVEPQDATDSEDAEPSGETEPGEWELPDLFVVDGGRGQLAVALAAARDLGLHELPIVALAKEKENVLGDTLVDRVYLPGQKNPIPLRSHSSSLFFLARARDEAHRFSNFARERQGKKKRMRSALEDVKGLGPNVRKSLLRAIGGLSAISSATDEQLLAVTGVQPRHVKALRAHLIRSPAPSRGEPETDPEPRSEQPVPEVEGEGEGEGVEDGEGANEGDSSAN
jgi:excinuclease ABC subunit C